MSLLSRSELDLVLYPERVAWHCIRHELRLRGGHQHHASGIIPCEISEDNGMPWLNAVKILEVTLPSLAEHKMEVNVILSNHFMQYILVPWFDKLSDDEEMAIARHRFKDVYGGAADSWSVRISQGRAGVPALAGAVDTKLLDELRGLMGRMNLNIKSIQPHLMVACNSCRASLEGRNAWLALLEPGSLCLALLEKGQLAWIRKMRIGDDWHEELATILEREAYLADANADMDDVLMWAPHLEDTENLEVGRWKIQQMYPGTNSGWRQEYGGSLYTGAGGENGSA